MNITFWNIPSGSSKPGKKLQWGFRIFCYREKNISVTGVTKTGAMEDWLIFFLSKWIHISTNKITMMIKQKIKNITKYNNINNTRNYTNTEP